MTRYLLMICLALGMTGSSLAHSVVTYSYDDAGRLIRAAYAGGTVIDYVYDAAGSLLSRTISGGAPSPIEPTLTTAKSGGSLEINYSVETCTSTDHAVLVGSLSDFGTVTAAHCAVGGDGTATIPTPGGSVWFLVAGVESTNYSSVGVSSTGERSLSGVAGVCPGFVQDTSRTCP